MNQIIGSPIAFKAGRRVLLVSYVSVGEWETFGSMVESNEGQAIRELVYRSLYRADPTVTRRGVRWLMWRHRAALTGLVELICTISLPKQLEGLAPATAAKEVERSMKTTYRLLSRQYGWTAAQISDMSPSQLHSYQMGGKDGTGIEKMTGPEYRSFRAQRGIEVLN